MGERNKLSAGIYVAVLIQIKKEDKVIIENDYYRKRKGQHSC